MKGRAARELHRFVDLFDRAGHEAAAMGLAGLVRWTLQESGYLQMLEDEGTLEAEGRLRNLEEFLAAAMECEALGLRLAEFLDRVTLASDADQVDPAVDLSLMTIHCAKGLEFPIIFVVGMEEEVFPNRQAKESDEGLEEERRLFYVAITRAKAKLYLSGARRRRLMGSEVLCLPSRFLRELPTDALDNPIRWGTELYQAGMGGWTPERVRGGGGASVATELNRIRSFFEKARATAASETEMAEAPPRPAALPVPGEAWPKGTRVTSPRFGRGVITAATGSGEGLTYTIRFETGEKRIVARFGMLERED